ncbi:MAG TPA: enoyl-CoA hydratase/isomerase family protein [Micromonosporaceae bacterium]
MTAEVHLRIDGGVALVTIDRPATRNAVSLAVIGALDDAVSEVESRPRDVNVFAIRGAGDRVFVSGGDLKELAALRTAEEAEKMAASMRAVLDRIALLPIPTVALLNGDAYGGGGEVAVACDMRIAAEDIRIGFTQSRLAIMPAWGGVERLTTLVGRARALYLLTTAHVLDARGAFDIGLVDEIVARANFDARSDELLASIAAMPTAPNVATKAIVNSLAPPTSPDTFGVATSAFGQAWASDEHWAAADARKPGSSRFVAGR